MNYVLSNRAKDLGNVYVHERRYGDAISAYLEALQFNYHNVQAHSNLSWTYHCVRNYDLAIEHATITISLAPSWFKGYLRLAHAVLEVYGPFDAHRVVIRGLRNCHSEKKHLQTFLHEVNYMCRGQYPQSDQNHYQPGICSEIVRHSLYNSKKKTHHNLEMEEEVKSNKPFRSKPIDSEVLRNNPFLQMAQKLTNASTKHAIQKEQMEESLKEGYAAFQNKKYRQAVDCYKEALRISMIAPLNALNITTRDIAVIHYILNLAKVESNNYEKIVQALKEMENTYFLTPAVPAFFYLLGKAYYKLNRFKQALEPLLKCEEMLQTHCPIISAFWPSTDKIIKETTKEGLEECVGELIHLCKSCPLKSSAICRFINCTEISSHILPSVHIYISDPDFIGFISLQCESKCNIQYHIQCWKAFKETYSSCEKVHDKDMLDRVCPTMDCITNSGEKSKICLIEIVGQDGKVKTQIKSELSSKQNISKNLKKKKQKLIDKEEKPAEKIVRTKQKPSKNKNNDKMKSFSENINLISSHAGCTAGDIVAAFDTAEEMKKRLVVLEQLRAVNFGCVAGNLWNYREPYYGRTDEENKREQRIFIPPEHRDEDSHRQFYIDFVLSWFYEVLSKEGPMKAVEIEEQWSNNSESASLFTDVKVVLSDISSISDLLLESTRFCLIDDYICVSEHLPQAYNDSKIELLESISFMLEEYRQKEVLVVKASHELSKNSCLPEKLTIEEKSAPAPMLTVEEDYNFDMYVSDSDVEPSNENELKVDEGSSNKDQNQLRIDDPKLNENDKQDLCHVNNLIDKPYIINDSKSFSSISCQTEETCETYSEALLDYQNTQEKLKNDLDKLRKQATKSVQIIKKIEDEKQKLTDQTVNMILKYETKLAEKELNFKKETEKIKTDIDSITDKFDCTVKRLNSVTEAAKEREEEFVKLEKLYLELKNDKKSSAIEFLEIQFKYVNALLASNKNRGTRKLSELQCLSKLDYLPCHKEVLDLTEKWNKYKERQSNCRSTFNTKYENLKEMISTKEDIDVYRLFIDMMPHDLTVSDPTSISLETVINQLITFHTNKNSRNNEVNDSELLLDYYFGPLLEQNINHPTTSNAIKDQNDLFVEPLSENSDKIKKNKSKVFEFLKNKNNKDVLTLDKKQKCERDAVEHKDENVACTAEQQLPIVSQQSKKIKKGKAKIISPLLRQSSLSAAVSSLPHPEKDDSVREDSISHQPHELFNKPVFPSYFGNQAENGGTEGEWQVIVDKKTAREQSSSLVSVISPEPKISKGHYGRLIERLKKSFPNKTEKELSAAVKIVRERNNSSLTGLSMDEIESRVEKLLFEKASKKSVTMGMEKFGETAWGGGVVSSNSNWQCSCDSMEECVICFDELGSINLTTLECHHLFHTECIRQWLKEKSVCPLCNKFATMPDEFPAL